MSTTDKLAQALRECVSTLFEHLNNQEADWLGDPQRTLMEAQSALAEYDALQVAKSGTTHSAECWRWHHDCAVAKIEASQSVEVTADAKFCPQCIAIAEQHFALVQQVERLAAQVTTDNTETADNARLAKDAERYTWLTENAKIEVKEFYWDGLDPASTKHVLDNAIDAATAQAKQAEGAK